jgi:hypothetical protein
MLSSEAVDHHKLICINAADDTAGKMTTLFYLDNPFSRQNDECAGTDWIGTLLVVILLVTQINGMHTPRCRL